jgi:AraC family transcriptional regulator of adaptative response/methylated-DNA-[protein]-cysteine methyltransferase
MVTSELRVVAPTTESIYFAIGISHAGHVLVAESASGICALYLGKSPKEMMASLQHQFSDAKCMDGGNGVKNTLSKVIEKIHNPQKNIDFKLDQRGTAFQQQVWQALCDIPTGTTVCYSDIAEKLQNPGAVRAIASACGANNIAVIVPCHRVIRKDGSLSGYRWGVEIKQALLRRERMTLTK